MPCDGSRGITTILRVCIVERNHCPRKRNQIHRPRGFHDRDCHIWMIVCSDLCFIIVDTINRRLVSNQLVIEA